MKTITPFERFLLGGSMVLLLLGFSVSSVMAYNREGPIWANQPSPGHCCANLGVYYSSMPSSAIADWDNGRSAWNASSAWIFFNKVGSSSIQVYELNSSYYNWDGYTSWGTDISGRYFAWSDAYINYYSAGGDPPGMRQEITAHELGHVAGLAHSGGCVLMQPYDNVAWYQCGINTPQPDDAAGINSMY